jgi:hypothetical protein
MVPWGMSKKNNMRSCNCKCSSKNAFKMKCVDITNGNCCYNGLYISQSEDFYKLPFFKDIEIKKVKLKEKKEKSKEKGDKEPKEKGDDKS